MRREVTGQNGSLLDTVVARRKERLAQHHLDLPVEQGGWNGDLVLRFRVRDRQEWATTEQDADVLAMACSAVLLRDNETGELREIHDDDGRPVALDSRLTAKLGEPDIREARHAVRYLFMEDDGTVNDMAISDMALVVRQWTTGRSLRAEAALLGGK